MARIIRIVLHGTFGGFAASAFATVTGWMNSFDPRLPFVFAGGALIGACLGLATRARALDVVAANAVLALLISEGVLRLVQVVAPSSVLWDDSSAASSVLAQRRCPEPWYFRYSCNKDGYVDDEFFEPGANDYVVALIADSFGIGMVPASHHFATLAEHALRDRLADRYQRIAIHNFSVSGAGLGEYRYLLETEIQQRLFAQVALCLFVGNDLRAPPPRRRPWGWVALLSWRGPEVLRRMGAVIRGVESSGGSDPGELTDEPAFLRDASLEPPTFTDTQFLALEADRLRYALPGRATAIAHREVFAELSAIHAALGDRLLLVIVPDEFQVNDALWASLMVRAAPRYAPRLDAAQARALFDREHPQRKILDWAVEHRVRALDLLPALRDAERDGRTYHLRDSHWNARGNRVAAEQIVAALAAYAESQQPPPPDSKTRRGSTVAPLRAP